MSQPKLPKELNLQKYKTLSLNLRYFRNRLQMTQEQVASRAGISTKYLSLIESASFHNPPTLEVVFDLADALGVEPYRIFKEL
ncbi:MAG: helix-turn-helix transcriptional regulator [Lachnospiraceae bacterium]|nr:helix-turn-helix transcriptional regulator [Lachnospiraceae bacterium]